MTFNIQIAGSELAFRCQPGQTLLDAGLHAGIEMPYSCRKGVCGNCAGRVAQGEVAGVNGAAPTNETCTADQVLYCMCTPLGDLVLQPTAFHRVDPLARKSLTARVFRNTLAAPDVSILQLRLAAGQRVKFKAGQFLQIALDDGSRRSYSMANAPHENDSVTLHIRHVEGGRFTAQVPLLQAGDPLRIELPFGSFALREDSDRPLVFVAGGTGFAPIQSILDDMIKRSIKRPATLFWGARQSDGLYLRPALERWHRLLPDFRFVAALSTPQPAPENAFAGPVHEAMLAHCPALQGHELYCCGSPAMVQAVRDAAVHERSLSPQDFHSDVFVSGPQPAMAPIST